MIFHPIKNYQIKTFEFNYVIDVIARTIFNTDFFKFIILHFYIVSTAMMMITNNSDYK